MEHNEKNDELTEIIRKPPKTKISDFLPSDVLNEIDFFPNVVVPKTSLSLNNVAAFVHPEDSSNITENRQMKKPTKKLYSSNHLKIYHNPFSSLEQGGSIGQNKNTKIINQTRSFIPPRNVSSDSFLVSKINFNTPAYNNNFIMYNNNFLNNNININGQCNLSPSINTSHLQNNAIDIGKMRKINYQQVKSPMIEAQIENLIAQTQYTLTINEPGLSPLSLLLEKSGPNLFIQMIKTNKGSRYLQKIIISTPPNQKEIDIIVHFITQNIYEVFCDYYGNYFLQKFLPYCSFKHRLLLYHFISQNFIQIANDLCGNHSLQSLIMLQNSKEEEMILKECIEPNLLALAFGPNSSHIIQKVISAVKEPNRNYINSFVISNLLSLCLDAHGICIFKEFIQNTKNEFYIKTIISILEMEITRLTFDQYGNFGIQKVIELFGEQYCWRIIEKITQHLVKFSVSKFSSNVVDFVLEYLSKNNFERFCSVITSSFCEEVFLVDMLKNKYATYVIENVISLLNRISRNNNPAETEAVNDIKNQILSKFVNIPCAKEKKKLTKLIKLLQDKKTIVPK